MRREAIRGIQLCDDADLPALAALLPLLGDTDQEVTQQAQDSLIASGGPHLVPLFQHIRRDGPGRQRARALTVLAELGGEAALAPADTAAVERLLRIKLLEDRPAPLWACWNHWIAVPSGDQAGIIETLGLSDPRPATFALGNDIVDTDGHDCGPGYLDGYARVFVTPELGAWCAPSASARPRSDQRHPRAERASSP